MQIFGLELLQLWQDLHVRTVLLHWVQIHSLQNDCFITSLFYLAVWQSLLQSLITFDYLLCLIILMAVFFLVAHLHQYNLSAWTNYSDLLGELMWTLTQSFDFVNHNSTLALDRACLNKTEFSGTETNKKIVVGFYHNPTSLKLLHALHCLYNDKLPVWAVFFLAARAAWAITISLVQLARDNDSGVGWNELQS